MTPENPFPPDCARTYRPVRPIATGGFGTVFEAVHRELERPVAIKLLLEDVLHEKEQIARFENEARVTSALKHPNVVQLLDFGASTGIPWIVYELLEGRTARQRLEAKDLGLGEAIEIVSQALAALAAAHAEGILHRDLKPENLLEHTPGIWKLTDFGIAKWSHEGAVHTGTGIVLGTPAYLAPELIRGAAASPASDLYAMGVMLHELVTGEAPFTDAILARLLEKHLGAPAPPASARVRGLPRALDALLARALAKDPAERPTSAESFLQDLMAIERAGPELARPTTKTPAVLAAPQVQTTRRVVAVEGTTRGASWKAWIAGVIGVTVLAGGLALRPREPAPAPVTSVTPSPSAETFVPVGSGPAGSMSFASEGPTRIVAYRASTGDANTDSMVASVSLDGGKSWKIRRVLDEDLVNINRPATAVSRGNAFVAWNAKRRSAEVKDFHTRFRIWEPHSGNWSMESSIPSGWGLSPSLYRREEGDVWLLHPCLEGSEERLCLVTTRETGNCALTTHALLPSLPGRKIKQVEVLEVKNRWVVAVLTHGKGSKPGRASSDLLEVAATGKGDPDAAGIRSISWTWSPSSGHPRWTPWRVVTDPGEEVQGLSMAVSRDEDRMILAYHDGTDYVVRQYRDPAPDLPGTRRARVVLRRQLPDWIDTPRTFVTSGPAGFYALDVHATSTEGDTRFHLLASAEGTAWGPLRSFPPIAARGMVLSVNPATPESIDVLIDRPGGLQSGRVPLSSKSGN